MTFEEFNSGIKGGSVSISDSISLRLIDHLPRMYQAAHYFWSWIWVLSVPVFIYVAISYKWWVGILLLVFVTPAISSATKRSASQFVLEYAHKNKQFYEMLIEKNILVFSAEMEQTPQKTINRLKYLKLTDDDFRKIHHFKDETIARHIKYLDSIQKYQSKESNNYIVGLRLAYLESLEEWGNDRQTAIRSCKNEYPFNENNT